LGAGLLVGLLPYAALPLGGSWPQPWGDMRSLEGWWDVVSARLYWGYAFSLPWAYWPQRLLAWMALMARQFTPLGGLLVVLGIVLLWKRARSTAAGLLMVFVLCSLYAIGYNTPDSLVYLVPVLPVLVLGLAEGLAWVSERVGFSWVGLVLPLFLLVWHWGSLDLSHDTAVAVWVDRTLAQTPGDAVLLTQGDRETFALWCAQSALNLRPDVLLVDRDLWQQKPYRDFIAGQTGQAVAVPEDFASTMMRPLCMLDAEEVVCP